MTDALTPRRNIKRFLLYRNTLKNLLLSPLCLSLVKQRSSCEQWKKEEFLSIRFSLSASPTSSSAGPSASSDNYIYSTSSSCSEESDSFFPVTTALGYQQPGIDVADLDSLERWWVPQLPISETT